MRELLVACCAGLLLGAGCFDSSGDTAAVTATSTSASTSSPTSTTSAAPVPAQASARAVTVTSDVVAGWWDGRSWVAADGGQPVPAVEGETYSVLGVSGVPTTGRGSAAREGCETDPGTSRIAISGMGADGRRPSPIAVSGVANPRPRPTSILDPTARVYRDAAGAVLAERGIDDRDADVVQALRADLEGDGKDEVVLVAERIADPGLHARPGDYSFVLLRRLVHGDVVTTVVAESAPDPAVGGTPFIYSHRVATIADLNGDGRMELVLELRQYEGVGVSVHEVRLDGSMPAVISADCGA